MGWGGFPDGHSKFYRFEEVDKSLGKQRLPKLTQEEANNLNSPLSGVEIRVGRENTLP